MLIDLWRRRHQCNVRGVRRGGGVRRARALALRGLFATHLRAAWRGVAAGAPVGKGAPASSVDGAGGVACGVRSGGGAAVWRTLDCAQLAACRPQPAPCPVAPWCTGMLKQLGDARRWYQLCAIVCPPLWLLHLFGRALLQEDAISVGFGPRATAVDHQCFGLFDGHGGCKYDPRLAQRAARVAAVVKPKLAACRRSRKFSCSPLPRCAECRHGWLASCHLYWLPHYQRCGRRGPRGRSVVQFGKHSAVRPPRSADSLGAQTKAQRQS